MHTGVFASVLIAIVILIGSQAVFQPSISLSNSLRTMTYTINGLSCPVPTYYLSQPSVTHLLPLVISDPRFHNLTEGQPFVFGNAGNVTGQTLQIENQPVQRLPDYTEMFFYGSGPNTTCAMDSSANMGTGVLSVHVPIQGGTYNLTGGTFRLVPLP